MSEDFTMEDPLYGKEWNPGALAKYRYNIGAQILFGMDSNEDLPLPNVYRLSRVMQEYFNQDGYEEDLIENGYSWRPTEDYWRRHISDIAAFMRKEKNRFLVFVQEQGNFKGRWEFVGKKEYIAHLARNYSDVKTRTETYNEKLEDGKERWSIQLPGISRVPLLQRN